MAGGSDAGGALGAACDAGAAVPGSGPGAACPWGATEGGGGAACALAATAAGGALGAGCAGGAVGRGLGTVCGADKIVADGAAGAGNAACAGVEVLGAARVAAGPAEDLRRPPASETNIASSPTLRASAQKPVVQAKKLPKPLSISRPPSDSTLPCGRRGFP